MAKIVKAGQPLANPAPPTDVQDFKRQVAHAVTSLAWAEPGETQNLVIPEELTVEIVVDWIKTLLRAAPEGIHIQMDWSTGLFSVVRMKLTRLAEDPRKPAQESPESK